MAEHTKGPWRTEEPPGGRHEIVSEEEYVVAETFNGLEDGEEEANARLIATAPEMFSCLIHHQSCRYCMDGRKCTEFDQLRDAAIAKAKGVA